MTKKKKMTKKKEESRPICYTTYTNNNNVIIRYKIPGVNAYWIELFDDVASGEPGRDWTDEEISAKMKARFPERKSEVFDQVPLVRARYNRGELKLNGQKRAPRKRISRIEYR